MLTYNIIETEVKPKLRFDFRFLFFGGLLIYYLISNNGGEKGGSGLFEGKYDWIFGTLALLFIIASVFIHYLEAHFYKTIGTFTINIDSFTIKKGIYSKSYSFSEIQEIRYGREHKGRAYKIELDDILLFLKLDQEDQKELENFIEKNILSELEIEGQLDSIKLK